MFTAAPTPAPALENGKTKRLRWYEALGKGRARGGERRSLRGFVCVKALASKFTEATHSPAITGPLQARLQLCCVCVLSESAFMKLPWRFDARFSLC